MGFLYTGKAVPLKPKQPQHGYNKPFISLTNTPLMPPLLISYLCLSLSMILGGIYIGLSKPLVTVFPVMLLAWLRYTTATPFMLTWFKRLPNEAPLNKRTTGLLALNSFVGSFLFTLCMLMGIKLTSALSGGIVMAGIPAAVAILSRIFLKERIAQRTMLAIMLAIGGILLLAIAGITSASGQNTSSTQEVSASQTMLGYLFLIASIFCEGSYVVIGKKLSAHVSAKRISAYMNLWSMLFSAPAGIYLALRFNFGQVEWHIWVLIVFYALTSSVITVWAWMTGLKNIPASSAGIFTIFVPIAAAITGLFMGEYFGLMHVFAFTLAIFGLVLATWPRHGFKKKPI